MKLLKHLLAGAALALGAHLPAIAADTGKLIFGQVMPAGSLQSPQVAIAIEKGLFKEAGLQVEIVRFPTGRRGLEAILGGQVDLAFMAEYPPVIAALQKQDFAILTQIAQFKGNRIIGRSDFGLNSLQDLAGKKIGTTIGSNSEYFTQVALQKAGVKAEIVNLSPPDIIPALDRGDIHVGIPFPDAYDKAREVLGPRYREIVSQDYFGYMVISASRKAIAERPGDIRKFLSALIKANDILLKNPADAKATLVAASQGTLTPAFVDRIWPEYEFRLGFDDAFLDLLQNEAKWVEGKGVIKGAGIDRAGLRKYLADGPITALDPSLNKLSK